MNVDKAIILAAGAGRRMKSGNSKPMTTVGVKRLIQYSIDSLIECNINTIYIVYSDYSEDVLNLKNIYIDLNLIFVKQEKVDGSLSSFIFAGEICLTPFLMLDCDIILNPGNLFSMLNSIKYHNDLWGYFAVVSKSVMGNSKYIKVIGDRVIGFNKRGFDDGYNGGMIYLWVKFPINEAKAFYLKNKSLSEFYDNFVKKCVVAPMYINQLWDVDTIEDILFTERFLNNYNE